MPSYQYFNMSFLCLLLWQILSVGCSSTDSATESEIILFPVPSRRPIETQPPDVSTETGFPLTKSPFKKIWDNVQDNSDEESTGDFFGFLSTMHLGPHTSFEDTWSTETLEDDLWTTLLEKETTTEATFELPTTLELPEVSSTSVYVTPSFTTVIRPTTSREESPTPETTTAVPEKPSGLSSSQIIGIIAGSISSLVVIIIILLSLLYRRRKSRAAASRPTIRIVSGPVPDPTARPSQTYLPVMQRQEMDSRDLLAGGVRRSGSLSRRSDRAVSELTPSEAAAEVRDTIDRIVDGYTSSVYSEDSERGEQRGGSRSFTDFSH